jgi:peptide deformylase
MLKLVDNKSDILKTNLDALDIDAVSVEYLKDIKNKMTETMLANDGIGLAANQVGMVDRLFIMIHSQTNKIIMCVNPEILNYSKTKKSFREGCLSFKGEYYSILRPYDIIVKYYDENKNQVLNTFSGIDSICFQHELDHLNGITFHKRKKDV